MISDFNLIQHIKYRDVGGQSYYASRGECHYGKDDKYAEKDRKPKEFTYPFFKFFTTTFSVIIHQIRPLKSQMIPKEPAKTLKLRCNKIASTKKTGTAHFALCQPSFSLLIKDDVAIIVAMICSKTKGTLVDAKNIFSRTANPSPTAIANKKAFVRLLKMKNRATTAMNFIGSSIKGARNFAELFISCALKIATMTIPKAPKTSAHNVAKTVRISNSNFAEIVSMMRDRPYKNLTTKFA